MKQQTMQTIVVLAWLLTWPVIAVGSDDGAPRPDAAARREHTGEAHAHTTTCTLSPVFRKVAGPAAAACVRVLADGKNAALGVVVRSDGYVATKASLLLGGKLTCRLPDGRELDADVVGVDAEHDVALVRVKAGKLPTVSWRTGVAPAPGSLMATVALTDEPLAVGVVSAEPRRIRGPVRLERERGLLGIGLDLDDAGVRISSVSRGTAAAKAGLLVGDRIESIDGVPMNSIRQVVEAVGSHAPAETIRLVIRRGEKDLERSATLGQRPRRPGPQDQWGGGPFSRRRQGFPRVLPHDMAVRPSDCGGPVIDTDGKVVGINIARALRVTTFVLPADVVRQSVDKLIRGAP